MGLFYYYINSFSSFLNPYAVLQLTPHSSITAATFHPSSINCLAFSLPFMFLPKLFISAKFFFLYMSREEMSSLFSSLNLTEIKFLETLYFLANTSNVNLSSYNMFSISSSLKDISIRRVMIFYPK